MHHLHGKCYTLVWTIWVQRVHCIKMHDSWFSMLLTFLLPVLLTPTAQAGQENETFIPNSSEHQRLYTNILIFQAKNNFHNFLENKY